MKRKEKKDGEAIWMDTFMICITVRNKELPNYAYIWTATLGLEAYIPAIHQCYKCGSLGHISKSCKCLICSEEKHDKEETCMALPSCINCKGGSGALNQSYPKIQKYWESTTGLKQAKGPISWPSARRTKDLLKLNRDKLRWVVGLLTGHCHLKGHLFKLGLTDDPICERCLKEDESVTHILCDCENVAYLRFCHLGHLFMEPSDYYDSPMYKVLHFIRGVVLVKG
jgi:hypothetical protein